MKEEKGKKLGLWNIVGLGLGGAIGTGIFVLLGFGIGYTGRSIVPVVVIGCFFMLLAYWYNLAMPFMFILEGGDYSMKAMLFNPLMTGVGGWMVIVNAISTSGYVIAITDYLCVLFPSLNSYRTICSFVMLTLFFFIHHTRISFCHNFGKFCNNCFGGGFDFVCGIWNWKS